MAHRGAARVYKFLLAAGKRPSCGQSFSSWALKGRQVVALVFILGHKRPLVPNNRGARHYRPSQFHWFWPDNRCHSYPRKAEYQSSHYEQRARSYLDCSSQKLSRRPLLSWSQSLIGVQLSSAISLWRKKGDFSAAKLQWQQLCHRRFRVIDFDFIAISQVFDLGGYYPYLVHHSSEPRPSDSHQWQSH